MWTCRRRALAEAHEAGKLLREGGYVFDVAYTSVLKRAIRTLWITLDEMDQMWLPIHNTWRLNERHYGALQGLNKAQTAEQYGDKQVKIWRRSYDVPPPSLTQEDPRWPGHDPRYAGMDAAGHPARRVPEGHGGALPAVLARDRWCRRSSRASGSSSRRTATACAALVKYLDNISDDDIVELNIPTGIPLVYELEDDLRPIRHYYLGDAEAVAKAAAAVAAQGQAKK